MLLLLLMMNMLLDAVVDVVWLRNVSCLTKELWLFVCVRVVVCSTPKMRRCSCVWSPLRFALHRIGVVIVVVTNKPNHLKVVCGPDCLAITFCGAHFVRVRFLCASACSLNPRYISGRTSWPETIRNTCLRYQF